MCNFIFRFENVQNVIVIRKEIEVLSDNLKGGFDVWGQNVSVYLFVTPFD